MINRNELYPWQEEIIEKLKTVYDPEIPVDIWELGLIYDIRQPAEGIIELIMTLTAPNCPVAEILPVQAREAVESLGKFKDVQVELTFDPPWQKEMMSDAGMLDLGLI